MRMDGVSRTYSIRKRVHHNTQVNFEATFVDDEAICLFAKACAELDASILATLMILSRTFSQFGLVINYEKGKTELMIVYRGKECGVHNRRLYIVLLARKCLKCRLGLSRMASFM